MERGRKGLSMTANPQVGDSDSSVGVTNFLLMFSIHLKGCAHGKRLASVSMLCFVWAGWFFGLRIIYAASHSKNSGHLGVVSMTLR